MRALRLGAVFVLFQTAWFACVVGAARGDPRVGVAVAAAVIATLVALSDERAVELRLVALALAVGLLWDSMLLRLGLVNYASPGPLADVAPLWILALWALFAPMLREPMRWLHRRPALAVLFGALGGPLSYAAAERLGACSFPDRGLALTVLGVGWGVVVPLLLAAAQRWERRLRTAPVALPAVEARP